ncbi:SpoIID/LytB domain-containing protein [Paenibacillus glufosinatiresistens]|uniref:SpoIID/LytB domain-containing protein n=1 Tax=Paenibacillus glufosinatiresistens TaxID=3070657 RepID=UPI00286D7A75|nr:SpoIID/LytB domain-containing protein [Paenibacillus sp. YX.27]
MKEFRRRYPYGRGARRFAPAVLAAAPLLAALLLPLAVVPLRHHAPAPLPPAPAAAPSPAADEAAQPEVSVYLSRSGQMETLPLEDYVSGVVAAEMPADFALEALKAQAIAARTFIVRRLRAGDHSGVPVPEADVTDTVSHQAYISRAVLRRDWAKGGRSADLAKIRRAVRETRGIVMTYRGEPITASFFASSGGYTENSEDYWKATIPYLRSVASPWDKELAPNYAVTVTFSREELREKLGLSAVRAGAEALGAAGTPENSGSAGAAAAVGVKTRHRLTGLRGLSAAGAAPQLRLEAVTAGKRVKAVEIDGVTFTGREVREKLGLRSSQFTWKLTPDGIAITSYGSGHGVGMSQWGANGMALEGSTATMILEHYYTGIGFAQVSTLLKK